MLSCVLKSSQIFQTMFKRGEICKLFKCNCNGGLSSCYSSPRKTHKTSDKTLMFLLSVNMNCAEVTSVKSEKSDEPTLLQGPSASELTYCTFKLQEITVFLINQCTSEANTLISPDRLVLPFTTWTNLLKSPVIYRSLPNHVIKTNTRAEYLIQLTI